jgi:5-methylcytosine-specific restriction enzyme A
MKQEPFGTANDYFRAFKSIIEEGVAEKHVAMLRAHYLAPNHTITWTQLGKLVGWTGDAVNLQYGLFARRVARQLGIDEKPSFWVFVLVTWGAGKDPVTGFQTFVLRRPVLAALKRLGIFTSESKDLLPVEVDPSDPIHEGTRFQVMVNAFERDPEARRQCMAAHGTDCCICGLNFGAAYGPEAEGFIHVHHVKPLSEIGREYVVDPVRDLRPVCPNCHAVLHLGDKCRTVDNVKRLVRKYGKA